MSVDVERLRQLDEPTGGAPIMALLEVRKALSAALDEIERLRAEVATFNRDENLAPGASLPKALDVIADQAATIAQLRAALTESCDVMQTDVCNLDTCRDVLCVERRQVIAKLRATAVIP